MDKFPFPIDERTSSDDLYLLQDPEEFHLHATELVRRCRYRLQIYSVYFDRKIFAKTGFVEAASAFIRAEPRNQLEILLLDTDPIIAISHPILRLQQRLSNKIKLRKVATDIDPEGIHALYRQFIIGDDDKLIVQHHSDEYSGFASYAARPEVRSFATDFQFLWNHSDLEQRLQRVSL